MQLESWDPERQIERVRRRANQMWDEMLASVRASTPGQEPLGFVPEVDLVECPDEYRIYLAVPGLIEDDIVIDLCGGALVIRGERQPPYDPQHRRTQMAEWRYGCFERAIELSTEIAVTGIQARYEAGVLTIVAPKRKID